MAGGSQCVFNFAEKCFHHFYLFFVLFLRQSARPSEDLWMRSGSTVTPYKETRLWVSITQQNDGDTTECFSKAVRHFFFPKHSNFLCFFYSFRDGWESMCGDSWSRHVTHHSHLTSHSPTQTWPAALLVEIWACAGWPGCHCCVTPDWATVNGRVTPLCQ